MVNKRTQLNGLVQLSLAALLSLASFFASAEHADAQQTPATLDRLHGPILRRDLSIKGATSCATSNCHGGAHPGVANRHASRGSEYQIWLEDDPHSRSWRTICGDESVAMMDRLGIMQDGEIVDQSGFDNCLACHNTVGRLNEQRVGVNSHAIAIANPPQQIREGVGCASCHGPSEQWGGSHYANDWGTKDTTSAGFVNNADLFTRARMCASCHVGDKDRDMNHDIIAAGHPVLRYEMATFHTWQPKHWRDAEADNTKCYESKLWLAGQIAATDASLALLEARAKNAHSVSVFPDLSSYDCASCHHNLGLDNQRAPFDRARQATARYSEWNGSGLRWLVDFRVHDGEGRFEDAALIDALDQVVNATEVGSDPNAERVAAAALHARRALASWFDGLPGLYERDCFSSDRIGRVVRHAAGRSSTFRTWESAAQYYLAVVAARASWPGGTEGPMKEVASRMRTGLRYPEMIDVSRYEKRSQVRQFSVRPTLTRNEAHVLGSELASWFGPVGPMQNLQAGQIDSSPHADAIEMDERAMNDLADRIQRLWKDRSDSRKAKIEEIQELLDAAEKTATKKPDNYNDANTPKPDKTKQQLIDDLRKRLNDAVKGIESDEAEGS